MALAEDAATLYVEETVENDSDLEVSFLWGHHPVVPALAGACIDLPPGCNAYAEPAQPSPFGTEPQRWPQLVDSSGRRHDVGRVPDEVVQRLLYVSGLDAGWAALRQPAPQPGVAMAWDRETLPWLWFWLQNGTSEFPWYGRARMLALEPQAAHPFDGLAAARGRGQAHRLGPRATRESWLTVTLLPALDEPIVGVARDGRVSVADTVSSQPRNS